MNYEVLDSVVDLVKWKKILASFPDELQDIYFYPEYVGMHKLFKGVKALLFVYQENKNIWGYPFLLQPIDGGPWFDIESAYGYGGPLSNTEDQLFLNKANNAFSGWCKKNNVIAGFIRFHPVLQNQRWIDQKTKIEYDRSTVSRNLRELDIDNLLFSGKVKNKIKRANKANVKIDVYNSVEDFMCFKKLYLATMTRINADAYYYFNESYFFNLHKLINDSGWLVGATMDGKWLGASLFIKGKKYLHYHLSARNPDVKIPGVSNSLILKGIELGADNGLELLHLGGGNSNKQHDSLFCFKRTMGDSLNKFFTGKMIYNNCIYNKLKNNWALKYPLLKEKYNNRLLCYRFTD